MTASNTLKNDERRKEDDNKDGKMIWIHRDKHLSFLSALTLDVVYVSMASGYINNIDITDIENKAMMVIVERVVRCVIDRNTKEYQLIEGIEQQTGHGAGCLFQMMLIVAHITTSKFKFPDDFKPIERDEIVLASMLKGHFLSKTVMNAFVKNLIYKGIRGKLNEKCKARFIKDMTNSV